MKITKIKLQLNTSTGPGFGTPIYVLTYPVDLKLKRSRKHPGRFELDEGISVVINNDTFAAGGDIYLHQVPKQGVMESTDVFTHSTD